ncbi:MAG: methyltransferase, FkbM family domain protein [Parcubacteria group bacterium Athens1014_10]|nr:MAG: methyltransferase, FkbM family domain protein [Parcubacteria group bacterium Athens1014_10]TSD05546.1 MAG: methyltransferase, FkbM family domain protein [Parcubacteria group bacterium Athens0714_12]
MLLDKKNSYLNGGIHGVEEKYKYTNEMFKIHKHLFEYSELIKKSPIKKIEINNEEVVFTINSEGMDILIACDKRDANSLPMMCLNFAAYNENEEMDMILKLVRPGDVVFDIGANIGWHTINILLKHKGVVVYSFEPIKSSYRYLIKNLKLNNLDADKTYNIGLSDENKREKFYFDVECAMASSMSNLRESKNTVMEECEIKRLDDFISTMPLVEKLDFIKCDVEGAELLVFKGAIQTIKKYKPIVFSEILRKWSKKFGYHPNDLIELFRSMDYECYVIHDKKLKKFSKVDDKTIETNYLFFHKEKHLDIARSLENTETKY